VVKTVVIWFKICDCFVDRGENKPGGWIFKPVPDNPDRCIFGWIFNTDLKVSSKLLNFAVELTCYITAHHTAICIVALLLSGQLSSDMELYYFSSG